jgi:hypothetical protein
MNMSTNLYPRRHRQFESKNLDYSFWGEDDPQEEVMQQQLPSQQSGRTIEDPRWRRLLVRAPRRRVPRRFAIVVVMEDSSLYQDQGS